MSRNHPPLKTTNRSALRPGQPLCNVTTPYPADHPINRPVPWALNGHVCGRIFWRRGTDAKIAEDADEAFEAAVCGHDFTDAGGGGGEMGEGVEEGQGQNGHACTRGHIREGLASSVREHTGCTGGKTPGVGSQWDVHAR